jgi:hypothetical protein
MFFFLFLVFLGVIIFKYILLVLIINGGGSCSTALSVTLNAVAQQSVPPKLSGRKSNRGIGKR